MDYELLDFGDGRRLERFGAITLDRPCPAAERFARSAPDAWPDADARFEGRENERGLWTCRRDLAERWTVVCEGLKFELKRTDFGHLGLFPEQAANWRWIRQRLSAPVLGEGVSQREPRVLPKALNLFAYTGGSTLAAAAAGAEVVHVDAAKNVVAWARRNAELSGAADAPIRWITEDALKFVKRETRRGNRYDAVILDPPSYGHGPHGEVWRLSKHLPRLLAACRELTFGRPAFMLLTCHTPGHDADSLVAMLREHFAVDSLDVIEAGPMSIPAADGRRLPSGVMVRWQTTVSDRRSSVPEG